MATTYPPDLEAYVQQKIASGEFHSRYIVFYRETPRGILVLRIIHGSRDISGVWRQP